MNNNNNHRGPGDPGRVSGEVFEDTKDTQAGVFDVFLSSFTVPILLLSSVLVPKLMLSSVFISRFLARHNKSVKYYSQ